MAVSFSSISGMVYPAWQSAFQASLEKSTLHGSQLFKHLWKCLSCMAVSFSSISGRVYPAWQSAFQALLGHPILDGCELFKHLWDNLSWMAVSFSSISGRVYPAWQSALLGQPILDGCELEILLNRDTDVSAWLLWLSTALYTEEAIPSSRSHIYYSERPTLAVRENRHFNTSSTTNCSHTTNYHLLICVCDSQCIPKYTKQKIKKQNPWDGQTKKN